MKRTCWLALALAAAVSAETPQAQVMTTFEPVISRIQSIGLDSSRTERLAHVLFDSLGPRLMGTPNTKVAGSETRQ